MSASYTRHVNKEKSAYVADDLKFPSAVIVPRALIVKLIELSTPFVLRQNPRKISARQELSRLQAINSGYVFFLI